MKRLLNRWYDKESLGLVGTNSKTYNKFEEKGKDIISRTAIQIEISKGRSRVVSYNEGDQKGLRRSQWYLERVESLGDARAGILNHSFI